MGAIVPIFECSFRFANLHTIIMFIGILPFKLLNGHCFIIICFCTDFIYENLTKRGLIIASVIIWSLSVIYYFIMILNFYVESNDDIMHYDKITDIITFTLILAISLLFVVNCARLYYQKKRDITKIMC